MDGSDLQRLTLGSPCVDVYLEFARARARSNTWLATAYDLLVFFSVVPKEPAHVTPPMCSPSSRSNVPRVLIRSSFGWRTGKPD
jgi:hypothetical protein